MHTPAPRPSYRAARLLLAGLAALALGLCARAASVGWAWTGGLTDTAAVVTARLDSPSAARLELLSADARAVIADPILREPMPGGALHRFALAGLAPDTEYRFRFLDADGAPLDAEPRSFRTFPAPGRPASFRFAVGSCAKDVDSPAFAAVARQGARFFLHTGDFHYSDIARDEIDAFRRAYDAHLAAPRLRALLATTPLFYQWDDHDFGPNDSNRHSPSRRASLLNYRQLVPHHPLADPADPDAPVDQAFSVGRVRFILSDLRSRRDPESRRMMSAAQDAWLRAELLSARATGHALVFWVSSVPWNGAPARADRWQGYPAHRAEIAEFIKANGLAGRFAILAGDAHMTAIDDGSNSDFATGGGAPVPVFQAGPLANRGSYKGGPYSHGARFQSAPDGRLHQFGLVDVADEGRRLRVSWSGRAGADGLGDEVLLSERDAEGPIQYSFVVESAPAP